jgi:glycosyltransferase involved in cell wall biosynthesis
MRICLYTDTALPKLGGQEMVVDALARQFLVLGQEVLVLAPRPRLPLRPNDRALPYPVLRHPRFYSTRRLVDWYRFWLLRAQRRFRFEVLHCHGIYPPAYLASLTRQRLNVPVVITSHGGDVRADGVRQSKLAVRPRQVRAVQSADALVAISRFTEQGFLHWGARPEQIVAIPNGVDLAQFATCAQRPADLDPALSPRNYVLFLGRLVRHKGIDVALEAWGRLPPDVQVVLVVAGAGPELAGLQELAVKLNVQDRVRFIGAAFGEKKTYLLQNALCTLMPSRVGEGFGLVALESFASGTPVIASRVAGLEDLIEQDETGWLVPPESPQALADTLVGVLGHREQCQRAGQQAAKKATRFSWREVAQRHLELYVRLQARPKRSPWLASDPTLT